MEHRGAEPVLEAQDVLKQVRGRLEQAFGDRLRGIILYGSEVRGEAGPDSDIDLLVFLEGPVNRGRDLEDVIHALYPLQLETDRLIDAWPADVRAYQAQQYAVYRHARREGVPL